MHSNCIIAFGEKNESSLLPWQLKENYWCSVCGDYIFKIFLEDMWIVFSM